MGRLPLLALVAVGALGAEGLADTSVSSLNATVAGRPTITRAEIRSRAMSWVNQKIPYCQCPGGDSCCGHCTFCGSYRCDCSGLVAYAWDTTAGLTTHNLGTVSHKINVADLQVGDALLNAAHHVILFNGWVDRPNLKYHALQEAGCNQAPLPAVASNTVAKIPGPPYVPMRFNGVAASEQPVTTADRARWQESALLPFATEEEERELLSQAVQMERNGTWQWMKAIGEL